MALLGRMIWFIVRMILKLIGRLLQLLFSLLIPVLSVLLRWSFRLMSLSLTATVHGPRQFTERLASEWTQRLLELGVSHDHLDQLYTLCRFLAASMIVLGWVVAALFTVAILRVVFGIFI